MKIVHWLDTIGNALILQILFFVFSLPIVTAFPAAVALQRQLGDLYRGSKASPRLFVAEFGHAWRQSWPLGVIVPVVTVGFAVAIPFWYSLGSLPGIIGFGLLVCLAGLACTYYLALLVTTEALRDVRWRTWLRAAWTTLITRSFRFLIAFVVFMLWYAIVSVSLPLLLVGSGLVPATIVYLSQELRRPEGSQAKRS